MLRLTDGRAGAMTTRASLPLSTLLTADENCSGRRNGKA
jgi:hypothetical protein